MNRECEFAEKEQVFYLRCINKAAGSIAERTMRAIPRIGDSIFLREKEARLVKTIY